MPPLSLRMLMIFLLAAAFLNFANYTFITVYDPPGSHNRGNHHNQEKQSASKEPSQSIIDLKNLKLLCEANVSKDDPNFNKELHSSPKTMLYDSYDRDKPVTTLCPELPPGLGPVLHDSSDSLDNFASIYNELKPGGIFNTTTCVSRYNVAIIVPFRGDKSNLATSFLYVLHQFLMKQQINYQIFIIEQGNTTQPFNRGKLLNVGFAEARHVRPQWDCFVFHEPNIVPLDTRNLYRCGWYPRQLAVSIEKAYKWLFVLDKKKVLSHDQPTFGGAVAMTEEQFLKANGFSNSYWANDADYDDLYNRLNLTQYLIEKPLRTIGKYRTLRNINVPARLKSVMHETVSPLYLVDGITSLTYTLNKCELRPMYTHILVNIDDTDEPITDAKTWDKILNKPTFATTQQNKMESTTEADVAEVNVTS